MRDRSLRRVGFLASASHSVGRRSVQGRRRSGAIALSRTPSTRRHRRRRRLRARGDGVHRPHSWLFVFSDRGTPTRRDLRRTPLAGRRCDHRSGDQASDWTWTLVASFPGHLRGLASPMLVDRTRTDCRTSFGRFFQPPQSENLCSPCPNRRLRCRRLRLISVQVGSSSSASSAFKCARSADRPLRPADVHRWWVRHVADRERVPSARPSSSRTACPQRAGLGIDLRIDVPRRAAVSVAAANSRVEQAGPITGGLFLEDELAEIAGGERSTSTSTERGLRPCVVCSTWNERWWSMRYEHAERCRSRRTTSMSWRNGPGAELVDFERGRVKPRQERRYMSTLAARAVASAAPTSVSVRRC